MREPLVDVIIPNYNKVDFLQPCLDSLAAQTLASWRAIVVDGHSDDGSWAQLTARAAGDSRFELHQRERTGCLYDAWNFGLELVTAPYFAILTSDDVWPASWLDAATAALGTYPRAACAAARTVEIDRAGARRSTPDSTRNGDRFFGVTGLAPQVRDGTEQMIAHYFYGSIYTSVHALVVRRSVAAAGLRFATDLGTAADVEWALRLGLHGDAVYLPALEVGWRVYPEQASAGHVRDAAGRQQAEGAMKRRIHDRNRSVVAGASPWLGAHFEEAARSYDDTVLAYDTQRPALASLRDRRSGAALRLASAMARFPRLFVADLFGKARGERLFAKRTDRVADGLRARVAGGHSASTPSR